MHWGASAKLSLPSWYATLIIQECMFPTTPFTLYVFTVRNFSVILLKQLPHKVWSGSSWRVLAFKYTAGLGLSVLNVHSEKQRWVKTVFLVLLLLSFLVPFVISEKVFLAPAILCAYKCRKREEDIGHPENAEKCLAIPIFLKRILINSVLCPSPGYWQEVWKSS